LKNESKGRIKKRIKGRTDGPIEGRIEERIEERIERRIEGRSVDEKAKGKIPRREASPEEPESSKRRRPAFQSFIPTTRMKANTIAKSLTRQAIGKAQSQCPVTSQMSI
jgi:hypothetical protein